MCLALMNVDEAASAEQTNETAVHDNPGLDHLHQWLEDMMDNGRLQPKIAAEVKQAMRRQREAVGEEFSRRHDTVRLVGQDNWRRYRPVRSMTIRLTSDDSLRDALICISAAVAVTAQVTLSIEPHADATTKQLLESTADYVPGLIHPVEESDQQLASRVKDGHVRRLRLLSRADVASSVVAACAEDFVTMIDEPVLREGRVECLRYLDEQSISHNYHRYGNLGRRTGESRREVP